MKPINRGSEEFITNEGYKVKVIEYFDSSNCTVQFKDGTTIKNIQYGNLKRGRIKNPYHKTVGGVGYVGEGEYKSCIFNKVQNVRYIWDNMLKRCYYPSTQKRQSTYEDCTVVEEWHNFQNFAKWYEENYIEGYQIDKDILIKGNKIYGPDTCCFVPRYINTFFTKSNKRRGTLPIGLWKYKNNKFRAGININNKTYHLGIFDTIPDAFSCYKMKKEEQIKHLALEFKDSISLKVYNALMNYQVEITD